METLLFARVRECYRGHGETCHEPIIRLVASDFWYSDVYSEMILTKTSTFTPQIDRNTRPVTTDDLERDHVLRQRIRLFGWVEEKHLDVPTGEGSQGFMTFAQKGPTISGPSAFGLLTSIDAELLKINHYKAPRDKLICILNCCKVIFGMRKVLLTAHSLITSQT